MIISVCVPIRIVPVFGKWAWLDFGPFAYIGCSICRRILSTGCGANCKCELPAERRQEANDDN